VNIASAEFSTVVEWLMYGGGITALVGLAFSFGSRGYGGMSKPLAVIGIVCFALGVLLGIYGGKF
jgi:hypothetical protein